jgi:formate dehydrogenase
MVKVLAILYDGGKAAQEEPKLLGTVENKVGLQRRLSPNFQY